LEKQIESKYPRYADLKRPKPLSVEELQEILKPGETLVTYAVGQDKSAAFVIGKERFKLVELAVTKKELAESLKEFREGLADVSKLKDLEKFKPDVSYQLYRDIFLPVISELPDIKKLYISADDILYTLPFEALVDRQFDQKAFREARKQGRRGQSAFLGEYAALHYLVDTYTITYLPSASVLRSLRKYHKPGFGRWSKPLIAFADPVFAAEPGVHGTDEEIKSKGLESKGINKETQLTVEILTRSTGSGKLQRLKESALEAEAICKEVKGNKADIYLREKATEENIHRSQLQAARYLLFSTHGLLGGDFSGIAEPALALTLVGNPPGQDGFLTMGEVLGLDLNAELVILSACNTYGKGDKAGGGEGFAGLTRSFMYAGTRSILVTHWSVESQAARELMVDTFKKLKQDPETKATALKEAKLRMRNSIRENAGTANGKLSLSHPFFWAPFVIVGESK
jgi:CHAT domain-containing protein